MSRSSLQRHPCRGRGLDSLSAVHRMWTSTGRAGMTSERTSEWHLQPLLTHSAAPKSQPGLRRKPRKALASSKFCKKSISSIPRNGIILGQKDNMFFSSITEYLSRVLPQIWTGNSICSTPHGCLESQTSDVIQSPVKCRARMACNEDVCRWRGTPASRARGSTHPICSPEGLARLQMSCSHH